MPKSQQQIEDQLLEAALDAAQGKIELRSQESLRDLIRDGVKRMTDEDRLGEEDIRVAQANIRSFVGLMKHQAGLLDVSVGSAPEPFDVAIQALEAASISLWPFWPPFWSPPKQQQPSMTP
jgi:hypothetical protein